MEDNPVMKTIEVDPPINSVIESITRTIARPTRQKDDVLFIRVKGSEILVQYDLNGKSYSKPINMDDFSLLFNKNAKYDTGILHLAGENYSGIRRYIRCGSTEICFLERSARTQLLKFGEERTPVGEATVHCPTLLLAAVWSVKGEENRRHQASYAYASKMPVVSEKIEIYKFPFGNVSQDGSICWGGHNASTYGKFLLADRFIESPFNGHLGFLIGEGGDHRNTGDFVRNLQTNNFKNDQLIHHQSQNKTANFGDIVAELVKSYAKDEQDF